MSTTYVPGSWPAVVSPRAVLLLGAPTDSRTVQDLWTAVETGGGLERVLAALLVTPLSELPSFALAVHEGDAVHVLVRGVGTARTQDGQEVVAGSELTWRETTFSPDTCVALHLGTELTDAARFPAAQGVVLAELVELSGRETKPEPAAPAFVPDQAGPVDGPKVAPVLVEARDLTLVPEAEEPIEEPAAVVTGSGRYDHMFRPAAAAVAAASTTHVSTEQAVESEPEPEPDDQPEVDEHVPVVEVVVAPVAPQAPGLIDGVPWLTGRATEAPRPPVVAVAAPVREEEPPIEATTRRGDHARLLEQLRDESDRVGPLVHAVSCVRGHLNDPQRERCRMCSEALVEQEPVTVPRPVLGQLRLSTGDVVALDRSVLLGRNPKFNGDGPERPHLMTVGQGQSDVSRSHVSVTLDGWHVLVEDLRSTNGTEVTLPGRAPQRLREGEPLLLEPGAEVVLAEGVSFRYEVAP